MKILIFIILFLGQCYIIDAQSKSETISWISTKFNKWKVADSRIGYTEFGTISGGTSEVPLSLSFINCNLVFKTDYSYIGSSGVSTVNTYTLNLGDVDKIEWIHLYNNDLLVISTTKKLVKEFSVEKNLLSYDTKSATSTNTRYIDRCIIAFDTDGENDFKARMLKAFNHLRTFCSPTKQANEVF
jgi:hypothetical protein